MITNLKTFVQVNVEPSRAYPTNDYFLRFDYELLQPLNVIFIFGFYIKVSKII